MTKEETKNMTGLVILTCRVGLLNIYSASVPVRFKKRKIQFADMTSPTASVSPTPKELRQYEFYTVVRTGMDLFFHRLMRGKSDKVRVDCINAVIDGVNESGVVFAEYIVLPWRAMAFAPAAFDRLNVNVPKELVTFIVNPATHELMGMFAIHDYRVINVFAIFKPYQGRGLEISVLNELRTNALSINFPLQIQVSVDETALQEILSKCGYEALTVTGGDEVYSVTHDRNYTMRSYLVGNFKEGERFAVSCDILLKMYGRLIDFTGKFTKKPVDKYIDSFAQHIFHHRR